MFVEADGSVSDIEGIRHDPPKIHELAERFGEPDSKRWHDAIRIRTK